MALPQVAILSNPWCAHNQKYMPLIRQVVKNSKNIFHFELDEDATVPEALEQFARTNPSLLIINGGDGTVHAALNYIMKNKIFKKPPVLAILATGRANKLAHDLGLDKKHPNIILEKLIHLAQVEGMAPYITHYPMIRLSDAMGQDLSYGVYFRAGPIVQQFLPLRTRIKTPLMPRFLASFMAFCVVLLRSLRKKQTQNPKHENHVPLSKIHLRGGGDISGVYASILATTLSILPNGRKPFGRYGKGKIGFSAVDYGFRAMIRAANAFLHDRIGLISIDGLNSRRSDEITIKGIKNLSLDDERITCDPNATIKLDAHSSLPFVQLKTERLKN